MHVVGGMVLTGHSVGVSKGEMPFDLPLNNYNIYFCNNWLHHVIILVMKLYVTLADCTLVV
jgi:hypothetical protein